MTRSDWLRNSETVQGLRADLGELRGLRARRAHRARDERVVREHLASQPCTKLQLGAGNKALPGWLCTDLSPQLADVVQLDATRPYPFADDTFDFVYAEHMIEHVTWHRGKAFLKHALRVLKPGGTLRIATPDLAVLVDLYDGRSGAEGREYVAWNSRRFLPNVPFVDPVFVINNNMRAWGHQFLYDGPLLTRGLERAGFGDVRRCAFGESSHRELVGIEAHGREGSRRRRAVVFETMVYEATKPGPDAAR